MPVSAVRAPTTSEPDRLRPYTFHGVDLTQKGSHAIGDCPFCGKEGKFSVDIATGLWRCFVCGGGTNNGGGNGLVFIRLLYERSCLQNRPESPVSRPNGPDGKRAALGPQNAATGLVGSPRANSVPFLDAVAADRLLLSPETAAAWGVCRAADGTWLVPGYNHEGRLDQVYRRINVREKDEWVWRLLPTPGIWPEGKAHALHLPATDFDPARPNVIICEGPWDGMVLWEVWDRGQGHNTNIIAVPGCNVWRDEWTQLCKGKCVTLMFDSDHPKVHTPGHKSRAGYDGMVRVAKRLSGVAASVQWVRWGPEGYDLTRPSGWDVRDHLSEATDRNKALAELLAKVQPAPADWFISMQAPSANGIALHPTSVEAQPCHTWAKCEAAWIAAMRWRQELSDGLAVLLAVCASTQQGGNQLFVDFIGSPGSAKTTICKGLLVSHHCIHLENVTKLVSGFKLPDDSTKDCSFISRANGKTWITCEFDTLGSSPEYRQLMGKMRRIFDGETSTTYGNSDKDRVYTAMRTPWIRAGTQRMMDHDQSQLGDRFMRFIINDPDNNERREIARSAIQSERSAMMETVNSTAGSMVDAKTRLAHALTGGYVDWLRANVEERLGQIELPTDTEDRCIDLAELSSDMRARPTESKRRIEEYDIKEMPSRLARQNVRLASCLAVVLNKNLVDLDIMRIVRRVALDTAHGHSLNIARWLCSPNPKAGGRTYQECGGLMEGTLATWTGMSPDRLLNYLVFLQKIDVLQLRRTPQSSGSWLLTGRVYDLYLRVIGG